MAAAKMKISKYGFEKNLDTDYSINDIIELPDLLDKIEIRN